MDNKAVNTTEDALMAYIRAFEALSVNSLPADLIPLFAENAYFEDPFNQVVGKKDIQKVFEHMFDKTHFPKFYVMHYALNGSVAFIRWEFKFFDDGMREKRVVGVSKVAFDSGNRVLSHIDYWDTGKYVYQKVPVLSWVIHRINRLLSATSHGKRSA